MSVNTTRAVNHERPFSIEELFFSTTDKKGVILSGNEVFQRISGYEFNELIGQPHNIIRHSEMPRGVFQLLWDYLNAGRPIAAYVKNMAKTGEYYWVVALVYPVPDGYLSIRLKPSTDLLPIVDKLYKATKDLEDTAAKNGTPQKLLGQQSIPFILENLKTLGFDNYDSFMQHALLAELQSRSAQMNSSQPQRKETIFGELNKDLRVFFDSLGKYVTLQKCLQETSGTIAKSSMTVRRLALNASIASSQLGDEGKTLDVIANNLGGVSVALGEHAVPLSNSSVEMQSSVNELIFSVCGSWLLLEIANFFSTEIFEQKYKPEAVSLVKKDLHTIFELLEAGFNSSDRHIKGFNSKLKHFDIDAQEMFKVFVSVSFIYSLGQIEAAKLTKVTNFQALFEAAASETGVAKGSLEKLFNEFHAIRKVSFDGSQAKSTIKDAMATVEAAIAS